MNDATRKHMPLLSDIVPPVQDWEHIGGCDTFRLPVPGGWLFRTAPEHLCLIGSAAETEVDTGIEKVRNPVENMVFVLDTYHDLNIVCS